jgi:leucyl-tRNA synthetase
MICKDGAKMSKSKGNVVPADDLIEKFGTDTVRLATLFLGPPEKDVEWISMGVEGSYRFITRLWRIVETIAEFGADSRDIDVRTMPEADIALLRKAHWTIKKVRDDIGQRFHFNTAISAVMELVNEMSTRLPEGQGAAPDPATRKALLVSAETCLHMLAPMIPHVCEELWHDLGRQGSIFELPFPDWDPSMLKTSTVTIVVQVGGKMRANIEVPAGSSEQDVQEIACHHPAIAKWLAGKSVEKAFYVKDKLINLVVS